MTDRGAAGERRPRVVRRCLLLLTGTVVVLGAGAVDDPAIAQSAERGPRVMLVGEELVYNVRYGFIDLGQVRIKVTGTVATDAFAAYESRAYIDSYSNVPFVNLHAIYESLVDTGMFARRFVGKVKDRAHWDVSRYVFEYDNHRVLIEVADLDTVVRRRDTLAIATRYHDGLSLFFYARQHLLSGEKINIPTLIKEEKVNTFIDFTGERAAVEVDAVDYPVDAVGFGGHADFVGIFGLTGGFQGWFSNDDARVPIMAKMKVIIGSVTIELMQWTRAGWTPPRAKG
ncbi:MAG: DUF3108 domain-containing protein [Bacteroidota bacterium]